MHKETIVGVSGSEGRPSFLIQDFWEKMRLTNSFALFALLTSLTGCQRSVTTQEERHSQRNPSVAVAPTRDDPAPLAGELNIGEVHAGDTIGSMKVVSVLPYTDGELTLDNYKIQFEGKVKLVGKFEVASATKDDFLVPGTVSFKPNKKSLVLLPPIKSSNNAWFILVKTTPSQFPASSGLATIVVDNYLMCSYPSDEVCNYADLVELIDATPDKTIVQGGTADR